LLGVQITEGTVHNVHEATARQAGVINSGIALSGVRNRLAPRSSSHPHKTIVAIARASNSVALARRSRQVLMMLASSAMLC
jgi:DNA integrity scanning protein DisA with diadenylate cyclase activity